jgi:uncharacterized phiE125 gp8 family phage protein
MPSILTTPPATEPVTLAEAKAHLRVMHNDDDAYISTLIKTARQTIEAQTGLGLISQGWSVFLDDWPEQGVIELPLAPVLDISDIKIYGEDDTPALIDPAHYYEDKVSRPARIILRGSRNWAAPGRVANGIEILLTIGFTGVPEPLREAVLQLVGHWYETRGDEAADEKPFRIAQLIQPYREMRL